MLAALKASDVGGDASDRRASLWFVVSIEVDFGVPMECRRAVTRCTLTRLLPALGVLAASLGLVEYRTSAGWALLVVGAR